MVLLAETDNAERGVVYYTSTQKSIIHFFKAKTGGGRKGFFVQTKNVFTVALLVYNLTY